MMLFPALTRDVLHAQASVASWLLVLVSLGIGAGALCCERLSRGRQPLALVPVGAVGMALFGGDVAWLAWQMGQAPQVLPDPWGLPTFLIHPPHWRLMLDVWLMAMSVGLFSVPLYADMQAQQAAAGGGDAGQQPGGNAGGQQAQDDVVDADFKEVKDAK